MIGVSVSIPSMCFGKGHLFYETRNPTMNRNIISNHDEVCAEDNNWSPSTKPRLASFAV
jgi:hypothetical protein